MPDYIRTITEALNNPALPAQLANLIGNNDNPAAPKAHLNYLFFNDKMELLPGNSGAVQVPLNLTGWTNIGPATVNNGSTAVQSGQIATLESGYVLIYIDNQTVGKEVWFDNLMVGHHHGKVVEEDHYYPFGLTLQTAQAANTVDQPLKLTTKELEKSFDLNIYDFGARQFDMQRGQWTGVDPKATEFSSISPYVYCADNPVRYIDPDGKKFLNFDANGSYTGTTKDNWFHNFFVGTKGRVMNSDGSVKQKFRFADPKSDATSIQNGTISKLVFVTDAQMKNMVAASGGFDAANKTANRSLAERYSYIRAEGIGGGKMDFSYTQIPKAFPGASTDPLNSPSSMIFLVPPSGDGEPNVAHNQMNFGNYMFGLSGQAQGFSLLELSYGAHYNSVANSSTNGYPGQLDSKDDQFSIKQGYMYGQVYWYDRKEFSVQPGTPQPNLVEPTTR